MQSPGIETLLFLSQYILCLHFIESQNHVNPNDIFTIFTFDEQKIEKKTICKFQFFNVHILSKEKDELLTVNHSVIVFRLKTCTFRDDKVISNSLLN